MSTPVEIFTYTVAAINHLTSSHIQLWIEPVSEKIIYFAGQYLKLRYPNGEFMPFSMANAPLENGLIELHVRCNSADHQTLQFKKDLHVGKSLSVHGPYGNCRYQRQTQGPLLLLAAGTGFAPAKAIIEQLLEDEEERHFHLYWTVREEEDFYLGSMPKKWQQTYPYFSYTPIITRSKNITMKKNILNVVINEHQHFSQCQVYVFGPHRLAVEAYDLFLNAGLPKEHFCSDML